MAGLTLRTVDGFEVRDCDILVHYSNIVRDLVGNAASAPLNIPHYTLKLVLSWCQLHSANPEEADYHFEDLPDWFMNFLSFSRPGIDPEILHMFTLFDLLRFSNYLQIDVMEQMLGRCIVDIIRTNLRADVKRLIAIPPNVMRYVKANNGDSDAWLTMGVLLADVTSPEFVDPAALADMLGDLELGL